MLNEIDFVAASNLREIKNIKWNDVLIKWISVESPPKSHKRKYNGSTNRITFSINDITHHGKMFFCWSRGGDMK